MHAHIPRRHFITTLGATALTTPFLGAEAAPVLGHGSHTYRVVPDWGTLDPAKYPIVNCHAMVQTRDGLLHTLCDGVRNNFLVYNQAGALQKAWGTEYPGAHGLEISDENGQEFFFVVDGGWMVRGDDGRASREVGRVTKITSDGKHVFTLGSPATIGAYEPGDRFQPCDCAIGPNGDIYVADGYGSQWVLQYDHNGKFIRKFGGPSLLNSCHGISIDARDPKKPTLVIASRSANQIKWFSLDGEYLSTLDLPGAYAGQVVFQGEYGYTGVCWSKENGKGKKLPNSGFICIFDKDNRVISNPGGCEPVYTNGKLQGMHQVGNTFMHVHDVCIDDEGSIYALQWNAKGAYPIKLERA